MEWGFEEPDDGLSNCAECARGTGGIVPLYTGGVGAPPWKTSWVLVLGLQSAPEASTWIPIGCSGL